jgi:hypothetical protein
MSPFLPALSRNTDQAVGVLGSHSEEHAKRNKMSIHAVRMVQREREDGVVRQNSSNGSMYTEE